MDLEKMIELVQEQPLLYDYNHKNYHDTLKKEAIWKAIGKKINQNGRECKKQWTSLRDSFRRNLRKRKRLNDASTLIPYNKKWKFEDEMNFLQPYLKEKPAIASQEAGSTDDESDQTRDVEENMFAFQQIDAIGGENNPISTDGRFNQDSSISEVMLKHLLETKRDEIETLFYSLAQTVKKMSPYYQAVAKARVCATVSELELENLGQQSNSQVTFTTISTTNPSSSVNISTSSDSPDEPSSNPQEHIIDIPDIKPF